MQQVAKGHLLINRRCHVYSLPKVIHVKIQAIAGFELPLHERSECKILSCELDLTHNKRFKTNLVKYFI